MVFGIVTKKAHWHYDAVKQKSNGNDRLLTCRMTDICFSPGLAAFHFLYVSELSRLSALWVCFTSWRLMLEYSAVFWHYSNTNKHTYCVLGAARHDVLKFDLWHVCCRQTSKLASKKAQHKRLQCTVKWIFGRAAIFSLKYLRKVKPNFVDDLRQSALRHRNASKQWAAGTFRDQPGRVSTPRRF